MRMSVFLPYGVALSFYSTSGKPVGGRHERRVSVASSHLAELIIAENIELDEGLVRVVRSHCSDAFGSRLLKEMETDGKLRDLAFWVYYAASEKPDMLALEELSERGVVQSEKTPVLGRTRYRELDHSVRHSWNEWIQSEFSREPSCRACATLAIALACGAEKHVIQGITVPRLEDRCTDGYSDLRCKRNIDSIFLATRSVAMGLAGGPGVSHGGVS